MATVTCAISGLKLKVSHVPMHLSEEIGYYHPIFGLPYKKLFGLYSKHCKGELTSEDSYLLFLSFLHATDQVTWNHHVSLDPHSLQTEILIENNLRQLITVVELTHTIVNPRFKQPSYIVHKHNCDLGSVHNWIMAWEDNIEAFKNNYRHIQEHDELVRVEKQLTWYIKSGLDTIQYSAILANWAAKAGDFPQGKVEYWKKIIRSCYNREKMFSTPQADIKELKAWIEDNIEPGSIHYHELYATLKTGLANQADFLGLGDYTGYTLLPVDTTKNDEALLVIQATAPSETPHRKDYPSDLEFLKARLKYRVACSRKIAPTAPSVEGKPQESCKPQESTELTQNSEDTTNE